MRSLIGNWLPPLLWSAAILIASGPQFSSSHSANWLRELTERVLGHDIPPPLFDRIHRILRKAGHLTAYGSLSALWFRALRGDHRTTWMLRWAAGAVALATLVASVDEWHQSFIPSRTGAIGDVFLDAGGAVLAQGILRIAQVLLIFHS